MSRAWEPGDEPTVGVLEPDDGRTPLDVTALEGVCDTWDAEFVTGGIEDVLALEPTVVIVPDESTLSAIARERLGCPVLPTGSISGIESAEHDRAGVALETALEGDATVRRHQLLEVAIEPTTDGSGGESHNEHGTLEAVESTRAAFDVTLVTDEPARISEFGVESRDESVASFRADGVVVATPAGSHGYASAIDGPELSRVVDGVAVVPIAPFVRRTRRWVLPTDDLVLTVERDTGAVALVVDGESIGTIGVGSRVVISPGGSVATLSAPVSQ
ncbi:NAD(+)/NADH kinase [Salinadaptatus halalkaliphilus]|uniref:NAD(+)/NADH kinase n=1 Tax=Salinadaptatus halalkaliphilus TaxID=2419781 RepID=A0A4V3VL61_9EURY|nr:NAD(+)/NADH kinase [Salinadaptatus halalkaliphilus]THE64397.1 NAD(+)/NADH kinase [Salinadaptatus halalkaliphilus]